MRDPGSVSVAASASLFPEAEARSRGASSAFPLPPLPPGSALDSRRLMGLFDRSAPHYERIVGAMSLGFGNRYRREALQRTGFGAGMRVLDVGTGPGTLARAVREVVGRSGSVTAIDPSAAMLREARRGGIRAASCAVAEALPFPDGRFDAVTMGYALRHVGDLVAAFREFHRVLRPGGVLLVLEQTPPATPVARTLFRAYMRGVVPVVTRLMTGSRDARDLMAYYWRTIEECVDPERVLTALDRAGLVDVRRHIEMGAFSEYVARRP
jgi:demethylmenaquinone methyltransferase/2-methoxy-6-polyprenyl-1,4-benzoquinol methylase